MGHTNQSLASHNKAKQFNLIQNNWRFHHSHGGILRRKRMGRGARPLSTKDPIHLVLKLNRQVLRRGLRSPLGFKICNEVIQKYSKKFYVKIEQTAINQDHIHLLVRLSKRSLGIDFFRVVTGQIAQQFWKNGFVTIQDLNNRKMVTDTQSSLQSQRLLSRISTGKIKIWLHRPFTRVIKGWRAYQIVRNYIQLNLKEANREIPYKKLRLKGLSSYEWQLLWG